MTGSLSRIGVWYAMRRGILALLVLMIPGIPALAQEKPSLKEILGRAQSGAERKAVEDLIGKLQGKPPMQPRQSPQPGKPPEPAVAPDQDQGRQMGNDGHEKSPATTSSQATPEQPEAIAKSPVPVAGDQSATSTEAASNPPPVASDERPQPEIPKIAAKPFSADALVEKAERKQLPSVDLEVLFEFDSARLTPDAVETLTTLGRALIDDRLAGGEFLIGGHTDAKGRAEYNLRLSDRRAAAVRQFLMQTFGIDAGRLTAKGFGSRYLKNPQQPRAAENRRVQVVNVSRQEAR